MTAPPSDPRLPALDGLRGVAILLVLFHHFTYGSSVKPATALDRLYFLAADASWFGVDLFFVLSGFLITGILLRMKHTKHYFRNFYLRRALRILPLYYAALFVVFWIIPLFRAPNPAFEVLRAKQAWYWAYLPNILYAREGWPEYRGLGHLWSSRSRSSSTWCGLSSSWCAGAGYSR